MMPHGSSDRVAPCFRGNVPLDESELQDVCPALFRAGRHVSTSSSFAPVSTIDVVQRLGAEGFYVVGVMQSKSRADAKEGYAEHILRLRHTSIVGHAEVGGSLFEVLLRSANGGRVYYLSPGLFRPLCGSSFVVAGWGIERAAVRHSALVMTKLVKAAHRMLEQQAAVFERVKSWENIDFTDQQRETFAEAAHAMRFPNQTAVARAVRPLQYLQHRRDADRGADVWHTLNRVHQNLLQGGLAGTVRDARGKHHWHIAKPVADVRRYEDLSRGLWFVAERMVEIA